MRIALGAALLLLLLGGCETLVGARKDLHTVGQALQRTAQDVSQSLNQ